MTHHLHPSIGHRQHAILAFVGVLLLLAAWLAPPAQAQTPWRFVAVGDTRSANSTEVINTLVVTELANETVKQEARFVIVPGDLVYSGSAAAFQQ